VVTTAIATYEDWLVTGTSEGNIGITDMHSGKLISCQTHSSSSSDAYEGVTDVQFVKGGNCFVTACSAGILNLWTLPGR
jgi:WD40 repeat protein